MLADAESYLCLGIRGNAVAERGTIAPETDCAQHDLVFDGAAAFEDEGAVHVSIRTDDEADAHIEVVIMRLKHWVGSEQGLGRTNLPTSRQCQRGR